MPLQATYFFFFVLFLHVLYSIYFIVSINALMHKQIFVSFILYNFNTVNNIQMWGKSANIVTSTAVTIQ
jgi:hypothetical protein